MAGSQSPPARYPALPQSQTPHRTFSEPATSPSSADLSPTSTQTSQSTVSTQSSTGYGEKSLQFDTQNYTSSGPRPEESQPSRRYSHDPAKVNGYTTCGRHGDDWLFGGFSVTGTVKKLWEKDGKE